MKIRKLEIPTHYENMLKVYRDLEQALKSSTKSLSSKDDCIYFI